MSLIAVIPARMDSSRFPGKPLAPILGHSMLEHVYKRTALCSRLDAVFVATPDEEIGRAVDAFGGRWIMTAPTHERASDRVAEAIRDLDADLVVMVQGDEPMTRPEMIDLAIDPFFENPDVKCVNLVKRIETEREFEDPNTIKVVMDQEGNALYFSREPIPTRKKQPFSQIPVFKQVCIIPFRRDFLLEYTRMSPTPLEIAESVDMMRILEHGHGVKLVETLYESHAVDVPEDLLRVENLMTGDELLKQYIENA